MNEKPNDAMRRPEPLLNVQGLSVAIRGSGKTLLGLDNVSFSVAAGTTLALVGESGCGKTMTSLALMGLLPPQMSASGQIWFDGVDLLSQSEPQLEHTRGRDIAMVFQDSLSSLNPVHTIGFQIAEVLRRHRGLGRDAARTEARRLLDRVQIPAAAQRIDEYPHELSGGMCQRAMIAMAIACAPRLLIADEPTTALDVTIQAQILALLKDIQTDLGMALVIITHDLGVVAHMAQSAVIMYSGRIIEHAPIQDLFDCPAHPYTDALLGALPCRMKTGQRLRSIPGVVPGLADRPSGCAFRLRCNLADTQCAANSPILTYFSGRAVACHNPLVAGVAA